MLSEQRAKIKQPGFTSTFRRPCKDCDSLFRPTGRSSRFCEGCILGRLRKGGAKKGVPNKTLLNKMLEGI